MGLYMYRFRKGKIAEASIIGVVGLLFAVYLGGRIADSSLGECLHVSTQHTDCRSWRLTASSLRSCRCGCCFVRAITCRRILKIGTIAFLIIGVILVHPNLNMPAFTPFTAGGGPVIPGKLYPFVFITIACGAISGFHALISSGTTPKMIAKETDTRMIGYGSMLMEGVVGIVALIAATSFVSGRLFRHQHCTKNRRTKSRLRSDGRFTQC